jgi:ribosomal 30S subunit maturation factor RimM
MSKFIISGAASFLIMGSSAAALAATAADCQALFDKADINRDGALQSNESSVFLNAMTQAQVRPQDASKVMPNEFMAACQKDAFANINPGLGTAQSSGTTGTAAEGSSTDSSQATSQTQQTTQAEQAIASPAGFMVSNLIGAKVTSQTGENIGDVKDVVLSPQGDATHVIIDIGEKDIEVERSKIDISATESGMKVVFGGAPADLAQLPAVNTSAGQQQTAATPPASSQQASGTEQTTTTAEQSSTVQEPASPQVSDTIAAPEGFMASSLIGAKVKNAQDENIGDIKDIVFSNQGEPTHVIVDIGDKDVEVEKSKLDISASEDGVKVVLNGTQADLAQLPGINVKASEQQTTATGSQATQETATAPATTSEQTTATEQTTQETVTAPATTSEQPASTEQTSQETTSTEQAPASGSASSEAQAPSAEQPSAGSETAQTTTAEQSAGSEAPAETQTATVEQPSTGEAPQTAPAEQALAIPDGLMVSDLIGATVYSPADEKLGKVNDLTLSSGAGQPPRVIIGVGGFLGIGEKDVAVDMSRLKFTTTDDGLKIVLDATKQDLENSAANSPQ